MRRPLAATIKVGGAEDLALSGTADRMFNVPAADGPGQSPLLLRKGAMNAYRASRQRF